jgi:poly(A) polymerase
MELQILESPVIKKFKSLLGDKIENFRLVGGCVRDAIIGIKYYDYDIATTYLPEEVIKIFNDIQIKVIPTGIKHGTVTVILDNHNIEITTLRIDVENLGRHAKVAFTDDWLEDAKRRDFTINAMSLDFSGKTYDYFNGREDLKYGIIKFVGDANTRIQEDYLRILRYFRFLTYYGKESPNNEILNIIKNNIHGIKQLSGERIKDEMFKLLKSPNALNTIKIMDKIGICHVIGMDNIKLPENSIYNLKPLTKLAIIYNGDPKKLSDLWKLSNKEKSKFICFNQKIELDANKYQHFENILTYGKELYIEMLIFNIIKQDKKLENYQSIIDFIHQLIIPDFPISGNDVMQHTNASGKEIGEILKLAKSEWIKSNFAMNKYDIIQFLLHIET